MRTTTTHAAPRRPAKHPPLLPMPAAMYGAGTTPDIVVAPARSVLAFDGRGAPGETAFQEAIGAIYGVAYTIKFGRKPVHRDDFKVAPLEARWWVDAAVPFLQAPKDTWRWRLRLAVPDDVSEPELDAAIRAIVGKRNGKLAGSPLVPRVMRERVPRTRYGRALHIGPYGEEPATVAKIRTTLEAAGLTPGHAMVEVYLSDPRRTAAERLKTVILLETE